jgi:cyclohexanecarboxylate-CoA ligase
LFNSWQRSIAGARTPVSRYRVARSGGKVEEMSTGSDLLSRPEVRLTPELVEEYRATGAWRDVALGSYLSEAAGRDPDGVAALSVGGETGERRGTVTYAGLDELAGGISHGLAGLGVGAGDAVSILMPNRLEFGALLFGILRLGAVYSGIPVNYGPREAAFMLRRARSKVLVVPDAYRGRDFAEMARELRESAPELENVVVIGEGAPKEPGWLTFDELANAEPSGTQAEVDPSSLAHIGFTSGTTGEPKGVMNTHQTLDAVLRRWVEHVGEEALGGSGLVNLIPSPVGHHTGFLWGALMSAYLGGTAIYLDRWEPKVAAEVMRHEGVTAMISAPTFLQDITRVPGVGPDSLPSLRTVSIPGAPIPRSLVPRAREQLGCFVCPSWGMTEWGIGLSGRPGLPQERMEATDGVPVRGCEVRIMRGPGEVAGPSEVGELQIRGAGLFVGYYDRPDFTEGAIVDGWFQTGDQATMDEDGFVSLLGRSKDIIIRGGQNIPVHEVENLLHGHPAVVEVAVIGLPDERFGERACAVLVVEADESLGLEDVKDFLLSKGLSTVFLPERVEVLEALPKTMSGKVRKVELREMFAREVDAAG